MNHERFNEIDARHRAATQGPWGWTGDTEVKNIHLQANRRGRLTVMDFWRWGLNGAQPGFRNDAECRMYKASELAVHSVSDLETKCPPNCKCYRETIAGIDNPDAQLIAHSWADMDWLLRTYERMLPVVQAAARQSNHMELREEARRALNPEPGMPK